MNTKDLESKITEISRSGYGTWRISIDYRGKEYTTITHNALAIDRISEHRNDYASDRASVSGYTYKRALVELYDKVKRDNELGEYKVSA